MENYRYLVQAVHQWPSKAYPAGGIYEEHYCDTKEEAELMARSVRASGKISYLWGCDWVKSSDGKDVRVRRAGETFLPWRDFS